MTDPRWNEHFVAKGWGRWPNTRFVEWFMRRYGKLSAEQRAAVQVLELGCGYGAQLRFLKEEGFAFMGLDGAPAAVEFCKRNDWPAAEIDLPSELGIVTDMIADYAGGLDCVFDVCTLQHLSETDARIVIGYCVKWLKPGGRFFSMHAASGWSVAKSDIPEPRLLHTSEVSGLYQQGMDITYGLESVIGSDSSQRRHWIVEGVKYGQA